MTTVGVLGRSRAGSSEILMASFMAASRPWPPSPLRAGPKHSGRLISSFTTTLAFSSTLSPGIEIKQGNAQAFIGDLNDPQTNRAEIPKVVFIAFLKDYVISYPGKADHHFVLGHFSSWAFDIS